MAVCCVLVAVSGCGRSKTWDDASAPVAAPQPVPMAATGTRPNVTPVWAVGGLALAVRAEQQKRWLLASVVETVVEGSWTPPQPEAAVSTPVGVPADRWACIATAERGGDPAMGPTYWTEYGVIIDVIEDYGTPEEQAQIFGGTANAATRLAPVARFAAENGFGGWGELTKQKCGL